MPPPDVHEVEHEITVAAPAEVVFGLIADVDAWPQIFPPTIHVACLERTGDEERIRIWATANGTAKTWTSRRTLDRAGRRIRFRQEVSAPPVAAMGGEWVLAETGPGQTRIRLLHDYRAVGDDPAGLAWIDAAVDRNSRAELAALKGTIERAHSAGDLAATFVDTVRIAGSARDAYDFVNEADRWAERLPHVAGVTLTDDGGLQTLEMETKAPDGSTHHTKSYRVCFPHSTIAYKQVTLPALLALHTGSWTFTETADGVTASSRHTIVLAPDRIAGVLGPDATAGDARAYVEKALSANSRATLGHAKDYAERPR